MFVTNLPNPACCKTSVVEHLCAKCRAAHDAQATNATPLVPPTLLDAPTENQARHPNGPLPLPPKLDDRPLRWDETWRSGRGTYSGQVTNPAVFATGPGDGFDPQAVLPLPRIDWSQDRD